MPRRPGTAFVVVALVAVPVAAGVIGASRAHPHGGRPPAKTQASGMPLLGYGAPART